MEKLNPDFLRSVGFVKVKTDPFNKIEGFALGSAEANIYIEIFAKTHFYIRASKNNLRLEASDEEIDQNKFIELIKVVFDLDLKKNGEIL